MVGHATWIDVGRWQRDVRRVIGRIHEAPAERNHQDHDRHLGDDDQAIDESGFLGSAHQQCGEQEEDHDRGNVDDAMNGRDRVCLKWRMTPLVRDVHPDEFERLVEILAPRNRHGRSTHGILEDQVPADDPGDELAHRGVRIGVRAAGDRDHRGEFGVAKPGEGTANACHHEGDRDRWARAIGDGRSGPDEEARADDGADAEPDQRPRPQRTFQSGLAGALGHQAVD